MQRRLVGYARSRSLCGIWANDSTNENGKIRCHSLITRTLCVRQNQTLAQPIITNPNRLAQGRTAARKSLRARGLRARATACATLQITERHAHATAASQVHTTPCILLKPLPNQPRVSGFASQGPTAALPWQRAMAGRVQTTACASSQTTRPSATATMVFLASTVRSWARARAPPNARV
jgi:hypothetical protein